MKRLVVFAFAASTAFSVAAVAAPEHARIRGTVASVGADTVQVKTTDGTEASITLDDKTRYLKVLKSSLDKVDKDAYIGTATKSVGEQLIALEVVIFPAAMKGAGEGHYGWDKIRDTTLSGGASTSSSMTNGTVSAATQVGSSATVNSAMTNGTVTTAASQGGTKKLTVSYKGGEQTILVPPTAPIVTFAPGDKTELTAGATVFINATIDDGKTTANSVAVGTDGATPPM
jgi:hypothetical protein